MKKLSTKALLSTGGAVGILLSGALYMVVQFSTQRADVAADAVRAYCSVDETARLDFRAAVNAELKPDGYSVVITCGSPQ